MHEIYNDLVSTLYPKMINWVLFYITVQDEEIYQLIIKINQTLQELVMLVANNSSDLTHIKVTLKKNFSKEQPQTREIIINWFTELFKNYPGWLFTKEDNPLSAIIQNMNLKDARNMESVLYLLCLKSIESPQFFTDTVGLLLNRFKKEKKNVKAKNINGIINTISTHLDPQIVFSEFAKGIQKFNDSNFVGFITETMDLNLAKSEQYKDLRDILKRPHSDQEKDRFFKTIFDSSSNYF